MSEKLQRPGLCRRAGHREGENEPRSGGESPACPIKAPDQREIREWNGRSWLLPTLLIGAAHFFVRKKENAFAQVFSHVNSHQGPGSSVKEKLHGAETLLC